MSRVERAKRGQRLPVVLSTDEVRRVLNRMRGVPRLCAMLMYGGGLRLTESVALRVKDVDFDRGEITVRGGKGDKDRRVPLPQVVVPALNRHLGEVRALFRSDLGRGLRARGAAGCTGPEAPERRPGVGVAVDLPCLAPVRRVCDRSQAPSPFPSQRRAAGVCGGCARERDFQASHLSYLAALVRHAPVGERVGRTNDSGASRTHRPSDDNDLHARPESRRAGSEEPDGSAVRFSVEGAADQRFADRALRDICACIQRVALHDMPRDTTLTEEAHPPVPLGLSPFAPV